MLMDEKALRARCSKARYDILRRAKPKMWKTGRLAGRIRVHGITELPFSTDDLWQRALAQVGPGAIACPYCEAIGRLPQIITLANYVWDHKVPVAHGGEHVLENLFAVCADCNTVKGNLSYEFFIALMREVEKWPNQLDRKNIVACLRTHGVTQRIRFAPKKVAPPTPDVEEAW